jgi:hypothetical protein
MRKTVELHDLPLDIQQRILACSVDTGYPLKEFLDWVNAGGAVAEAWYYPDDEDVSGE